MSAPARLLTSVIAALALVFLVVSGLRSLRPSVPRDMPKDSHFVQSGYDLQHNEPQGQWIACRMDAGERADWCRVTDQRGEVVYQGMFLPLRAGRGLPESELKVASADSDHLWVRGPEGGVVPAISLVNGDVLVPRDDRDALRDRWTSNPEELQQIERASSR